MNILGVSAYYHDSAACLVQDGDIVAAAQEERFTRKKHDPGFPHRAVEYCLTAGGIRLRDVEQLVFYDKPLVKFERLLETYLAFAPTGLQSFLAAMPVWMNPSTRSRCMALTSGPSLLASSRLGPTLNLATAAWASALTSL